MGKNTALLLPHSWNYPHFHVFNLPATFLSFFTFEKVSGLICRVVHISKGSFHILWLKNVRGAYTRENTALQTTLRQTFNAASTTSVQKIVAHA